MKRILVVSGAFAALMLASAANAQTSTGTRAQNGKFCLEQGGSNAAMNCGFQTMAACEKDAAGKGGKCIENPKMTTGSGMSGDKTKKQ